MASWGDQVNTAHASHPNWLNWKSDDWNAALISAIFRDPNNLGRPIKRVTASARFLAQLVHAKESEVEIVKEAFLRSFGSSSAKIRTLFRWTELKKRSLETDCPIFFAQLYLTLLAGSADEKTFSEGKFRTRFALLMSHANVSNTFPFDGLAMMWEALATWANKLSLNGGQCRPLSLPDPLNENKIGYSKRLAFPSFIDERKLGSLIARMVDPTDWSQVSRLTSTTLSQFSGGFGEEFRIFSGAIANGKFDDAFNSPFWGAVQDLTWDVELVEAKKNGRYILTLDLSDPHNPWIDLWGDELAIQFLDDCTTSFLPADSKGYKNIINRDNFRWSSRELRGLVKRHTEFANTTLGKKIVSRDVALLSDEFGRLSSAGKFIDKCRVALMVHRSRADSLLETCKRLDIQAFITAKTYESDVDAILYFPEISEKNLSLLAETTNDSLVRSLYSRRSSIPISISGGSWMGQLLLFSPASAPVYRMNGAFSGEFELFNEKEELLCRGELVKVEDDGFRIPPQTFACILNPTSLKISLNSSTVCKEKAIYGRDLLREGKHQKLTNLNRWKVEGFNLCLSQLNDEMLLPKRTVIKSIASEAQAELKKNLDLTPVDTNAKVVMRCDYEDIHEALRWIWDALALRFQYTQTISYREVREIAEAATFTHQLSASFAIRILTVAGWLVRLSNASFRADSYACGINELIIETTSNESICRVLGPLSTSRWNQIKSYLEKIGITPAILLDEIGGCSLGVLEITFEDFSSAQKFAEFFEMPIHLADLISQPICSKNEISLDVLDVGSLISTMGSRYERYVRRKGWVEIDNYQRIVVGELLRPVDKNYRNILIYDGINYIATDSEFVSKLIALELQNEKIGIVNKVGDLTFNTLVTYVPRLLSRWSLSYGAGCVNVGKDGSISLLGLSSKLNPSWLKSWIDRSNAKGSIDTALVRRNFALSKRTRTRHIYQ